LIVNTVRTGPDNGVIDEIVGVVGGVLPTVKSTPLLGELFTVTTTFPVIAPLGTGAVILVALQAVGVAVVPLNLTVLVPCVAPKLDPAIVTTVAIGPHVGLTPEISGPAGSVKSRPSLGTPPTVTTTLPVVAPLGTGTVMLDVLQAVGVAVVPLKVTVLVP
jgi:hypothetical protein